MACSIPSLSHLSLTAHCVGSLNTKPKLQATYVKAEGSDTSLARPKSNCRPSLYYMGTLNPYGIFPSVCLLLSLFILN